MAERVPEKIAENVLMQQVSEVLFERDYNEIPKILEEYRKGEIQKKLEAETDPGKQIVLMMKQAEKRGNFKKKRRKGYGRNR